MVECIGKGGAINAVLAAAGCNFRRLLSFLGILLRIILQALARSPKLGAA